MILLGLLVSVTIIWSLSGSTTTETTSNDASRHLPLQQRTSRFFSKILHNAKSHKGSPLPPRIDLVFILDRSSAVGSQHIFGSLQTIAQRLVSEFSVSPSTTRVGLILCSTNTHLQFGLNKFVNRECTLKAMKNTSRHLQDKHCRLGISLQLAHRIILQSRREASVINRPRPVIFVLNASPHDKQSSSAVIAKTLRDGGAEIFLLAIGHPVSDTKMKKLVSGPIQLHYFNVKHATQLDKTIEFIKDKGRNQASCSTKGTAVYDECRRRCQCSHGRMVNCYRVRKDFPSMSLEERRLYIQTLKTASTVQPYSRVYDEMTSYHPTWFDEIHQLKYFFPWHRWYILEFENFLRQIDCRVTVPYWDWSRAISDDRLWSTAHFHDIWYPGPHALGGNGEGPELCVPNGPFGKGLWTPSPQLNVSCLTREFNHCWAKHLPSKDDRDELLQRPFEEFEEFERDVREWMHDDFHNAIGGIMSLDASANAPEFWFHHGFLDKMWTDWQKRGYKYKHQWFHGIKSNLPGLKVNGATFIDLSLQPLCVRVEYDNPKDIDFTDNQFNPDIKPPTVVLDCDDESNNITDYDNDD